MDKRVGSIVLGLVVLGAISALPPALMLLLRVAKLDLRAQGVVVVPALEGGAFALASALILAGLMLIGADLLRWVSGSSLKLGRPTFISCSYGYFLGVALFVAILLLSRGSLASTHTLMRGFSRSSPLVDKLMYVLALVVVAPLAEEVLFRGAFNRILATAFKPSVSAALSALAFAIAHGVRSQLPFYFVAGVLFSILAHKTKSLVPSMIAHGTFNALILVYVLVL